MCWDLYKFASGLSRRDKKVQVATLLPACVGKIMCRNSFSNFNFYGLSQAAGKRLKLWNRNSRITVTAYIRIYRY